MEPFFKAATPDDRTVIEVKVCEIPSISNDTALFVCSVTLDGVSITESLRTVDQNKMISWMRKQMTEAMRRNKK
jgi:hypothetical protein